MENVKIKKGLVLGGGGAKGCFEIGACQAFGECGIKFDVVTGTSIGALVGSMMAQENLEPLVDFVYDMRPDKVMVGFFDMPDNIMSFLGEAGKIRRFINKTVEDKKTDITPLRNSLIQMFDYDSFMYSNIEYGCMTFDIDAFEGKAWTKKDMTRDNVYDILLASAACYPAMPPIMIDGKEYIDGGYSDNVPVSLAVELGAKDIIAIHLKAPGLSNHTHYEGENVVIIEPILELGNFLDFENEKGKRSLRTGYLEMMKYLGKFEGYFYTFPKEAESIIQEFESFAKEQGFACKNPNKIVDSMYKDAFGYYPPAYTNMYKEKYFYWCFLECLAFKHKIDPVNLYSTKGFFTKILENGPITKVLKQPKKESSSIIKNLIEDKEEINNAYYFVYQALVQFIMNAKEDI